MNKLYPWINGGILVILLIVTMTECFGCKMRALVDTPMTGVVIGHEVTTKYDSPDFITIFKMDDGRIEYSNNLQFYKDTAGTRHTITVQRWKTITE